MDSTQAANAHLLGAFCGAALAALLITGLITRVALFIFIKLMGRTIVAPFLSFAVSAGFFLVMAIVRNNFFGLVIIPLPLLVLWLIFDLARLTRQNALS